MGDILSIDHVHKFSELEIDTIRQWFEATEDLSDTDFLEKWDYVLAKRIYQTLGMRVPHRVLRGEEK